MIGEVRASAGPTSAPTVLCYGHFDVQPPDPLELWDSPPFEPEIRGEYLYGRGTVDDKGNLYMQLAAARELALQGELPVNVRFCCDGEEEIGGHSIVDFLAEDERGADAAVIFDSLMIRRGLPAFDVATRGLAYFHITLRTGERDLHSGMYGGAALNAAHALMTTLQSLVARDGTLPERAAGRHRAADRGRARRVARAAHGGGRARGPGRAAEGSARGRGLLRADVRRACARRERDRRARRTCRRRCCRSRRSRTSRSGSRPVRTSTRSSRSSSGCCARPRPAGAELTVDLWSSSPPGLVPPDVPAIQLGLDAFERALGGRPALIRSGGTLPIVPRSPAAGIPTVVTGFGLPDSQIHSPNERLVAEYVPLGIRSGARALPRVRGVVIDLHSHVLFGIDDGPDDSAGRWRLRGRRRGRHDGAGRDAARPRGPPDDPGADGGAARRRAAGGRRLIRLVPGGEIDLVELARPREELVRFLAGREPGLSAARDALLRLAARFRPDRVSGSRRPACAP